MVGLFYFASPMITRTYTVTILLFMLHYVSNIIVFLFPEFSRAEFVEGAKAAVEYVSGALSEGEFDRLKSVVSPECLSHLKYTVRRSLGYLDWAGVLTKLLLGREFEPRRGTFSQFHQKSNAL